MKVLLTIWISAVLIQEVIPSTLIRLPRRASNKTSLVHTEYEAKYEQKGKHGNESFSSVSGKQHFAHDNCSENWNAFAEKCASLIKDLVASLANVVTSKPGDATNLQLHIKNTFRHFDNTHNCTFLNHTGKGLSDLDLSPLFNNITITTVGPAANGVEGNNVHQNNCGGDGHSCDEENGSHLKPVVVDPASNSHGGDNNEFGHNQFHKCSNESCAGHDNNTEKGIEGQEIGDPAEVPQNRRKSNALLDTVNPDMHPSNAGNSNDQSTNNNRRQVKYPQVSRQPENLIHSSDDSDPGATKASQIPSYPMYPQHSKNGKQILHPFLVTPLSDKSYPARSSQTLVDQPSVSGHSPDVNPPSLPENKSSVRALLSPVSSLNNENVTPSFASHLKTSPGDSDTSPNLPSNLENAAPNHSRIGQQATQTEITSPIITPIKPVVGDENKLPVPLITSHTSDPAVVVPATYAQNSKPVATEPIIKRHNFEPSLLAARPATENHNTEPTVFVPVKKKEPLTMIPVTNSNSNLPESLAPENQDVKSVSPSPIYEPIPTGPSSNPSSIVVKGKNPAILPPEEDNPANSDNKSGVDSQFSGGSKPLGVPTSSQLNHQVVPDPPIPFFPLNSTAVQPTSSLQNEPQYPHTVTENGPANGQEQPNQEVFTVTPIPVKGAAGTTPFLIYPVKPLPAVSKGTEPLHQAGDVQPYAGPADPDAYHGENQQPHINLLTTPIPPYPMKTITIPADTHQVPMGNNNHQQHPAVKESDNEFPQINKKPEYTGQHGSGNDRDDEAPSTGNLGIDDPWAASTGANARHGVTPVVLQSVKPVGFPNSEAQTGGAPLEHSSDPLGQSHLSGQPENSHFWKPIPSDNLETPDKTEPVTPTEVRDYESQRGKRDPLRHSDESGQGNPLGNSDQSGHGDPSGHWDQSGQADPSGHSDKSGQADPLGHSDQSGQGDPSGHSDQSGHGDPSDHSDQSGYGDPLGHSDESGYGNPSGHSDQSGHGDPSGHSDQSGQADPSGHSDKSGQADPLGHSDQSGQGDPSGHSDQSGHGDPLGHSDQSGHGDPLGHSDKSGQADPLGHSDQSGYGDPLGHPDQSGHGDPSGHSDKSGQADPLGHSDQSGHGDPLGHSDKSGQADPLGHSDQSGQGDPLGHSDQSGQADPSGHSDQSGYGDPLGHPDQSGHGDPSGHWDQSGQADPSGHSDKSGQADPLGHSDQSGHGDPLGHSDKSGQAEPLGHSDPPAAVDPLGHFAQEAVPELLKPSHSENGVTPAITGPVGRDAFVPNGKEQSGNNAVDENPVLIRPTTFQTTSVEPTAPPAVPITTTKPIPYKSVPHDSYETLPVKPSTSLKSPLHHGDDHDDDDDDDDEDCCSCESCTEEEILDPKQFKENACKNLEEARKELKMIFDKIKKKLKCGRKAPRTITTQTIS